MQLYPKIFGFICVIAPVMTPASFNLLCRILMVLFDIPQFFAISTKLVRGSFSRVFKIIMSISSIFGRSFNSVYPLKSFQSSAFKFCWNNLQVIRSDTYVLCCFLIYNRTNIKYVLPYKWRFLMYIR